MKITFCGHSCLFIEAAGKRIIIDPFLDGNPQAKLKPEEVNCDYVIVTHGHGDHFGDTLYIAKKNKATVIANFEIAMYCSDKGCKVHPMHIGGSHAFDFGRVKLTIAHHGSGLIDNGNIIYLGNPAGVLLTAEGKTLYHAGDTALFYDMKLIGERHAIDVAFLPIGDNFTMGINDAVKATEFLDPQLTVPMHYKTFDVIDVDPEAFVKKLAAIKKTGKIIGIGETLEV